jgi:hypothetical protein
MASLSQILGSIFKWAIVLGAAGTLVSWTIYMRGEAFKASSDGLVSLSHLNRQLTGSGHHQKTHSSPRRSIPKNE